MSVQLLKNEAGERRYVLFLLFLVSVLSYVDRTILSILQVPIKADLGLSDSQLGALTGLSFALFYATLAVPLAHRAVGQAEAEFFFRAERAIFEIGHTGDLRLTRAFFSCRRIVCGDGVLRNH